MCKTREAAHFGPDAIEPGGYRHREYEEFVEWASHYDDGTREGRNRQQQEAWLARLSLSCVAPLRNVL